MGSLQVEPQATIAEIKNLFTKKRMDGGGGGTGGALMALGTIGGGVGTPVLFGVTAWGTQLAAGDTVCHLGTSVALGDVLWGSGGSLWHLGTVLGTP